jgi:Flp pilus assembly protein TadD
MQASTRSWILWFCAAFTAAPVRAQELQTYSRAEVLIREGRSEQGIALLRPLLTAEPGNLKALNLLGIALTQQGDLTGANREYRKALEIQPRFFAALKNLAANEFNVRDIESSEKHFREAAAMAPEDPVVNAFLGQIALSRNDFAGAAAHLAKAGSLVTQSPTLLVALVRSNLEIDKADVALAELARHSSPPLPLRYQFELGLVLAQHDYFERATPYFEAVQAKFQDSYDVSFNLAVCYVETKQYPRAITLLTALKAAGRNTAELENLLADAYKGAEQIQPAIDALREATQMAPDDENNYIDLVALCIDHDSFNLGMEVMEVGLHYRPQSDRLIFQRGILHAMKNEFALADQDFQLASQLAPEKNLNYLGLGVSYMQSGNLPQAVRTLRERANQKPDDPILLYLFGEALIRSGTSPGDPTFAEAKGVLEHSVGLNPVFVPSRVELAKLYLHEDRVDQAVALLERARSLEPGEKSIYSQLAAGYRKQKKADQAAAALTTLARLNEEQRARESHGRTRLVKQDSSGMQSPDPSPEP